VHLLPSFRSLPLSRLDPRPVLRKAAVTAQRLSNKACGGGFAVRSHVGPGDTGLPGSVMTDTSRFAFSMDLVLLPLIFFGSGIHHTSRARAQGVDPFRFQIRQRADCRQVRLGLHADGELSSR